MSDTSTMLATEEEVSTLSTLSSSLGPISSPRRLTSEFSRAYKQASNFFLTRRFSEAFLIIKPFVTVSQQDDHQHSDMVDFRSAPIARTDKRWRVKLWSFYLTLLNAVAELGPEEGKAVFGKQQWKSLVAKAENGTIWEEVVNTGYGGIEARVDAEVVINLANLLLAQSPNQKANQQHLEIYLSVSGGPDLALDDHFGSQTKLNGHTNGRAAHMNGTSTPRDLEARIQIIELYALHVLPRNGEWSYAKDFISMNEMLDEERKDAFLQTLSELEDEDVGAQDEYEDALPQQEGALASKDISRTDSNVTIKPDSPPGHSRMSSEKDYGIEDAEQVSTVPDLQPIPPMPTSEPAPKLTRRSSGTLRSRPSRPPPNNSSKNVSSSNVLKRSMAVISVFHKVISNMTLHMSQNPMLLLRFVVFVMGLVIAFSRRGFRNRVSRATGAGWDKIRKTIGMGVKVSYI